MSAERADGLVAIEAAVTSVFYRRPSPGDPPFVEEGSQVNEDSVVCLLEIMKCFRSVPAAVKGKVVKIVAQNENYVKKGDVLMLIRPEK
ncbi:MAG: Biotin carboxyl carrier protein of acetyl-CoA carboxylase [Smithella sp. PtaU1.Bin162]|nr:MAG: Biotin carboxyl carrier protein of acetyl-CoA carboxylase [Smithella sp. PtaU1.Bin162]